MTKKTITPEDAAAVLGSLGGRKSRRKIDQDAQELMQVSLKPYRARQAIRKMLGLSGPLTYREIQRLPAAAAVSTRTLRGVLAAMIEADEIEKRGRKYGRVLEG
jgi:hypothetical protein